MQQLALLLTKIRISDRVKTSREESRWWLLEHNEAILVCFYDGDEVFHGHICDDQNAFLFCRRDLTSTAPLLPISFRRL